MPTRMIRESLLDSDRYWSVTIEARQLFVHMLLLADDFGCISVSPTFLRRRCFNDSPSVEKISKLLNELQDVDLIRMYDVDQAYFAFIPRFKQRLQRRTLKHPAPPDWCLESDPGARALFNQVNGITEKATAGAHLANADQQATDDGEVMASARSEEKRRTSTRAGARENLVSENQKTKPRKIEYDR